MNLISLLNRFESLPGGGAFGIFLLRIVLAAYWGIHLVYKSLVLGMGTTVASFAKLGYPAWVAWGDVTLEAVAVLCLLAGVYTRSMSLLLLVILVPALQVWIPHGFWALKAGYEFPLLWIILQVILAITGPGAFRLGWDQRQARP